MSLRDVDVIDYIGVNKLFRRVYVGLFDDLDWRDEHEHQQLLTKKIDRYISYIRSGKLLASYPSVRRYEIVIEYVSTHPMPPSALEFWKSRERLLAEIGFTAHIRGVDVRRSLGIEVEEAELGVAEKVVTDPVEPPALEVLDPDPHAEMVDIADVAYLPSATPRAREKHALPLLRRLATRRVAAS